MNILIKNKIVEGIVPMVYKAKKTPKPKKVFKIEFEVTEKEYNKIKTILKK